MQIFSSLCSITTINPKAKFDLNKKIIFLVTVEQLIPQAIRFILFVVLARLLEPGDFGLVAMLALFMAIASVFVDAGFSAALIQRKDLTADDETSIFAFNIITGFAFAILLCLISPLIAAFYQQPILIYLLCANSLTLVIGSFGMVHSTLLSRNMLFKKTACNFNHQYIYCRHDRHCSGLSRIWCLEFVGSQYF